MTQSPPQTIEAQQAPAALAASHSSAPPEVEPPESYETWRSRFARERLRVLYYLGLTANLAFIAADVLLHREHLRPLLEIRAHLELGLLICFFVLIRGITLVTPEALLILWVLIGNLCIVQMTVELGGFSAQYYNGLNLVFLAAGVIVPISWPSHLLAQLVVLISYYGSNFFFHPPDAAAFNAAIENSFFLIWTCVAVLFSVYLYERVQHNEFHARVSERQARQQLEASNRKLLELDHLKSEFFANISHELRTPLTLCLGTFRTLFKLAPSPESRELAHTGTRNASRLLFLINELLDLARFDSGRAKLTKQWFDLCALVRNVAANFESSGRRRVHLRGMSRLVPIEADPRQLKKVLYNLLSNAFKFSDPEEGQAWIGLTEKPDSVELAVEDNGIGIPREHLDRIFDRFTQVEGSATRRYEGTGIGLALAKEIVASHGGRVAVESIVGQGSTFTITLPRTGRPPGIIDDLGDEDAFVIPEASLDSFETAPQAPAPSASGDNLPLVLAADDNPDMRRYLQRILSSRYRVVLAKDGAEAWDLARVHKPDMILTDAMMPKMSGDDLLKAVRSDEQLRSTPVIFLTARAGTEARVETLEAGADDYLSKPFDEHEVFARVGNLIRARAQERELLALQQEQLKRFLPAQVADLLLSGNAEQVLKSRRKEITVLFIDLRGFTAFADSADPEDVMAVLRQYQSEMGRIITAYQGTLERFSGDAMMVFFNDPLPLPNHPEQAVRMAIVMRDRVHQLQDGWKRYGFNLGAGVGIATGYATLGVVGYEKRMDYAAIGRVTNLAARLCGEAQHGQILVSGRVYELVNPLIQAEPVGDLKLKGFQNPVSTYRIVGVSG
ncbi:MAG: ATP-binding protein [Nitrospiraceae bacterium]